MQANYAMNRLRIKDTTITVNVPPNFVAQLKYYLYCVNSVLNYGDLSPYTDYNYYLYLSQEEIDNIIFYAKLFNPTKMESIKVFKQDDSLPMTNQFFEITDETYGLHINEDILIEGKIAKILKIMVYRSDWVIKNYYIPLSRLTTPSPPSLLIPPLNYLYTNNYYNANNLDNDEELCCCNIF